MILAVDIGNTHIVLGCLDGQTIIRKMRMATNVHRTDSEYAVELKQMLEFERVDTSKLEGAIVSSVVPPITETVSAAIKKLIGGEPLIVGTGIKTGLNILIDNPAQLGSDLVVGAVAALATCKPPLILFDMGTATTISVIDRHGSFLGGAIFPGVSLSMSALVSGTSQLPKVPIEPPKKCISTNTIDCMKSGAVFGTAAMVDGMIDRIEEELGEKAKVLATGGLAGRIVPYCRRTIEVDDDLLLRGLAIIYAKNVRK